MSKKTRRVKKNTIRLSKQRCINYRSSKVIVTETDLSIRKIDMDLVNRYFIESLKPVDLEAEIKLMKSLSIAVQPMAAEEQINNLQANLKHEGGFKRGELMVIGGLTRPSMNKSMLVPYLINKKIKINLEKI